MEEKIHGGKRKGAGRKPSSEKKKPITLYVEAKFIFPFGNEDKMKGKLYEFISGYRGDQLKSNIQFAKITPESFDGPKSNNIIVDEMGQWPEQKTMFSAPIDKFQEHKSNITYSDSKKELISNVTAMKKEMYLNNSQKMELEAYAKQVMEEKGFIYND